MLVCFVHLSTGLLRSSSGTKHTFPALRKALKLLVPDIDEREPADVAYAYAGYAPVTLRLVEGLLEVGAFVDRMLTVMIQCA